jgi:SAM-dependent methyltransferase
MAVDDCPVDDRSVDDRSVDAPSADAPAAISAAVREYYGSTLTGTADLRTNACCDASQVPAALRPLLDRIHPEVLERYYGCGLVVPPLLENLRVLDLGCGSGRDVYLLAQLVGPAGSVVGVDMTPGQLAVARRHQAHHAERFGYANVTFLEGAIERLEALPLEPGSFDLVISNCVVNLSTDKRAVLAGVRRLLRPGGEFYFADVFADRRIPAALQSDPLLYGECLSGALYWHDFLRLARSAGFGDPRLVSHRPLAITDPELARRTGPIRFCSATTRLFHLDALEDGWEDYGQTALYRGTIPDHADALVLDSQLRLDSGREVPVCGNTVRMLRQSRFAAHVECRGDESCHRGRFPGGDEGPFAASAGAGGGGSCC